LIGAVAVLLPIFTFLTIENINRQKEKSIQLLLEKGAALIRSFEAGTRFGMMDMHRGGFQLQRLLTETAHQPDIVYLLVADINGIIRAHNNLEQVGKRIESQSNLAEIFNAQNIFWRQVTGPDGTRVFEVFRKFSPARRPKGMRRGSMMMGPRFHRPPDHRKNSPTPGDDSKSIIFVGLDMTPILEAQKADIRHGIIMGVILLLVGFAGFMLLFILQSYRTTRASLSRIKAFSDNVVENMPIGLVALDNQLRIAALNNTAESVLQLVHSGVTGENAEKILPPEIYTEIKILMNQDATASPTRPLPSRGRVWEGLKGEQPLYGPVVEKEIDCTVGDGNVVPLEIGASLLEDENKTSLGYVILFKDLTEVRLLRREIDRSRRLASVGRLAAGVAHEIRNPLSSIKGFATYFKERYQDIPQDQQTATIMIQEVDRLNRVVSQLLEFARPVDIKPQPTNLNALIDDSVKLIENQALQNDIAVKTRISSRAAEIMVDPDRLNQVLLNLYLNAIESMVSGGELKVELSSDSEAGGIDIKIADTGCGISAEDLPKIFDPYYTTKSSGTGLGLAIAHNIIEAIGGQIQVESQPAQGTTFRITIPNPTADEHRTSNIER
jgi:two-component system sensor histidine kinase HydH